MKNFNYITISTWILFVLLAIFVMFGYGYKKGFQAGKLAEQQAHQAAMAKQQTKANKVSLDYEKQKTEKEVKRDEQKRQITKIVKVPIYNNNCLDASGLQLINNAINDR